MNNTMESTAPGIVSAMLGQAAYAFAEIQPYLPMYLHLIVSALFPIFTGAHASLVRPSTAAKPVKKGKKKQKGDDDDESDDDDDDESAVQKMEGLSSSDAIVLPVLAGSTLAGLYFLIKWMGADIINKVLGWYFSAIAIFSVAKLIHDGTAVAESFFWPDTYADDGTVWKAQGSRRRMVEIHEASQAQICSRTSPLPGIIGRVRLPSSATNLLWSLRHLLSTKYRLRARVPKIGSLKVNLTIRTILCTLVGFAAVSYSYFISSTWWLTNLQGFAFSYSALQLMSPTTFGTGSLILIALFFYDIYFVFFTPMMVTVATKLDVPIKLLFPRPAEEGDTVRKLAMLGLGDIVLPGIVIGLALRFDLYMHYLKLQGKQKNSRLVDHDADQVDTHSQASEKPIHKAKYLPVTGQWGNRFWSTSWMGRSMLPARSASQASSESARPIIPTFSKPYFYASIVGYVIGMCTTLGIMQAYHHAQPALLYLVPGVLISIWLTAVARGELKEIWAFSEAVEESDEEVDTKDAKEEKSEGKDEEKTSWWSRSFFSSTTRERNAKAIEKNLSKSVSNDKEDKDDVSASKADSKSAGEDKKQKKPTKPPSKGFYFSLKRQPHPWEETMEAEQRGSKSHDNNIVVLSTDTDVHDFKDVPQWRGARVSEESKQERPEKRLRTS
ncbi:hypothetical protein AAFC00_001480 [Neodothiora populina]|uniref:Signal peptide peptidase n=1 Tax=Neodothiora populina TaxID=2781224 RepID=A0ABR3PP07_9PEZI